jgi:hypothetical protein
MQTFVPYSDLAHSASVLDRQRLGKQRVETLQILKALCTPDYGWQNHPAVKMWRGHRAALLSYQEAICAEWTGRGYKDTCLEKSRLLINDISLDSSELLMPSWMGNETIHVSHRSNLLRKLPEFYKPVFESELSPDLPYVWPVV